MTARVTDTDRLSFTVFLALAFHAILVLGITFTPEPPQPAAQTLSVTLAQRDDREKPEEADYLAQSNQKGSGEQEEKKELTTPRETELEQPEVAETQPLPQQARPQKAEPPAQRKVTTVSRSRPAATEEKEVEKKPAEDRHRYSLMQRSLEIASLEARLDQQRQAYAKRPRIERVTAASTMASDDAWYVNAWVDKITRVGNLNYPEQARKRGIHGTLRMLVAINKDGTIREIAVLDSSGYKVLDDAAKRIVRLAAPFTPFTEEMRRDQDVLEIIRTWSFQPRGLSSG
ncbi:energy transducer TonB [Marinobacteraceae bacterium S3BR75-40.1]